MLKKFLAAVFSLTACTLMAADAPKIEEIDKNFKPATVEGKEVIYFDAMSAPFSLEGFPWYEAGKPLYRLPQDHQLGVVSDGVYWLGRQTSGGAIRFRTDSPYVTVRAKLRDSSDMNHMTRTGSAGFDIYKDNVFAGAAQPNPQQVELERIIAWSNDGKVHNYLLNLPLYGAADDIEIGIHPDHAIEAPLPHKITKPVLFYGSSITQGGCASRPGNMYPSHICRKIDAEQINLGFSGSAKGEEVIAKVIASLDLALFVMDYDHNSATAELKERHYPFYKIVRDAHPELPIIMVSKCDFNPWDAERRSIILDSFNKAKAEGDKFVYFVDGETLFGTEDRDACTVDGCHPNDLGFYRMYQNMMPAIKEALNLND